MAIYIYILVYIIHVDKVTETGVAEYVINVMVFIDLPFFNDKY